MPNKELVLRTKRICLVASTLAHIEAEIESPQSLGALLGVSIPSGWPPGEYDRSALEFFREQFRAGGESCVGWYSWYALTCDANGERESLIAGGGYLGPPSQGSVEVGYSILPEARGRGYAKEIVTALVTHAFDQAEVRLITANTSNSNVPSTRVLLRCGFHPVGPGRGPGTVEYRRARTECPQEP